MTNNYLITGYWGEPHVTAENDRGLNAGIFGDGRMVLPVGNRLRAEYIGNNTVRVYDGKLLDNGALGGIPAGKYVDLLIPEAGQGMKRNDLVVFQYSKDASTLVETGIFVVVPGEETSGTAADPVLQQQDLLTDEATFDQMALYRVAVEGATIGAPEPLFQISKSFSSLKFGGASMANSVVMEYDLGNTFTDEQSADIRSGKFEKVHVGGYWTINGRKYWAAHADYRLHYGDTELTTHHMLVIPDRPFYNGVMNDTSVTTGAYYGSKMKTSGLADALATVKADFGADHILTHSVLLANAVSNGLSSGWAWYDSQIDLMNEHMVYGSYAWGGGSQNGNDTGADKSQLALFQARPDLITNRENWWLRDVQSAALFCGVDARGHANFWGAPAYFGVRPAFLVY